MEKNYDDIKNERDVLKIEVKNLHNKQTELHHQLHPQESSKAIIVFERMARVLALDEPHHSRLLNYARYVF